MSNVNCNKSNNIHFNYPALMEDGRNFGSYIPGIEIDNRLQKNNNIKNNNDYRKYLQENAVKLMETNFMNACDYSNIFYRITETNKYNGSKPYIFGNIFSRDQPYGYENSDLKELYLSRQELDGKIHAPRFDLNKK